MWEHRNLFSKSSFSRFKITPKRTLWLVRHVFQFSFLPLYPGQFLEVIQSQRQPEVSSPGAMDAANYRKIHHMVGALPHRTLSRVTKKHGPVMYLKLGQLDAVVISSVNASGRCSKCMSLHLLKGLWFWQQRLCPLGQGSIFFALMDISGGS